MSTPIIQCRHISKSFNDQHALINIDLEVRNGEFLTLLGPSGCGKTTLLRILAGFVRPDEGQVLLNGADITRVPPEQRHINMVFQNYALFPHMNVYDNVAFGLRCQGLHEDEVAKRVDDALAMVRLATFAHRKPEHLSGGQQQRVAIARAVVNRPLVLLLDEPLSALDYSLRKNMRIELKQLQRELDITFIFVTHDQEEALSMSDRIAVFNHGHIEQVDTARQVYEEPKTLFTAQFIGEANIFNTEVQTANEQEISVRIEGEIYHFENKKRHHAGDMIHVIIRPEDIQVWNEGEIKDTSNMLTGHIMEVIYKGSTVDLILRLPSGMQLSATEFFNEDDPNLTYSVGDKVFVQWTKGWEVTLTNE
ncbi:MAG: spermidine/putrescine ABC transporter ATP-binding protein PotA [Pseudomonadota bacterium]|nr:spermidine/putrescine ABC transporter ATP-binding protein PotA [Pseudomonadota bacterium]